MDDRLFHGKSSGVKMMGSLGVSETADGNDGLLALTGLDLLFSKTVARGG